MEVVQEQRMRVAFMDHTIMEWFGFKCRRCGREAGHYDESYIPEVIVRLWLR